ncbi:hypothetical protein FP2_29620 [Faecalibacterium prausnitzii L2-6]|uniref:Uncharacterized protein n=2 Tax=Faecalibacterium TaxID=216851 RepID=D4K1S6_9FIRM|nr:hypothetical protein FP2_29620 [Faecalibacterium prausnitzii L2-6]
MAKTKAEEKALNLD